MYRPSSEQVLAEREHGHGHAKSAVADGGEITATETSPGVSPGRWVGSTEPPARPRCRCGSSRRAQLPPRRDAVVARSAAGATRRLTRSVAAVCRFALFVCLFVCLLALRGRFRPSSGLASGR
jgi:hypothetical protein